MEASIETFVFAHGRGRYLENCLRSLAAVAWPWPVTVFDDGSRDRASLRVLRQAESAGIRVERRAEQGRGIWGGLQANMARALELAVGPLVLFIQDDTQVVRRPSRDEVVRFRSFLADERNSPFLFPSFQMESWRAQDNPHLYRFEPDVRMWFRTADHRFAGFSDVTLFDVTRLRRSGWDPSFVEKEAAARAMEMYGPMAITPYPFVAFLPYPHTPRRGFRYRLKQPKRLRTPAAIRVMTEVEAESFVHRDPNELAFASRYLQLESRFRKQLIGSHWVH
jgi:glycosyltransferase involved in cell wall biosynthesis